jgi:uncharacterized protein (DUF1499 family)
MVRLARAVLGLGGLAAIAVLLVGPAYRFHYISLSDIQTLLGFAASAALAAIIGGLAVALLLPARDDQRTALSTTLSWLFRIAVLCVFGTIVVFLGTRLVPGLGAQTDPQKLLALAGGSATAAVAAGILWGVMQPSGTTRPGLLSALLGVGLGVAAASVPLSWRVAADTLPRINDITTDTAHPPPFQAPRRDMGAIGDYPGEATAAAQRAGYPDIRPLILKMPLPDAFARVQRAGQDMGWEIVASDAAQGRLEAVATTAWFGFRDDIVVRLTAVASGTRVDVRSRSRLGLSDLGVNARRIRAFLARLQQAG